MECFSFLVDEELQVSDQSLASFSPFQLDTQLDGFSGPTTIHSINLPCYMLIPAKH